MFHISNNAVKQVEEDAVYAAHQMEKLLYSEVLGRIPVRLFTDSESTLESIVVAIRSGSILLLHNFFQRKKRQNYQMSD